LLASVNEKRSEQSYLDFGLGNRRSDLGSVAVYNLSTLKLYQYPALQHL
jgi:hypothetical protein